MKRVILAIVITIGYLSLYAQIELINGKIGIGTTTPQVALDLRGNEFMVRDLSDQIRLAINTNGNVGIGTSAPNANLSVNGNNVLGSLTSNGIFQIGLSTGDNLAFDKNEIQARSNGASEDLLLQKNGGQVGIGTNTPSAKLDVRVDSPSNRDVVHFRNDNNGADLYIRNEGTKYSFYDEANGTGDHIMTFNATGQTGIGTSDPQQKLHIKEGDILIDNNYPVLILHDNVDSTYAQITGGNANLRLKADINNLHPNSELTFEIDGNKVMQIDTDGDIGLGTTTPTASLDIEKPDDAANTLRIKNTSNTSLASPVLSLVNGGTSGGDMRVQFVEAGTGTWYSGMDVESNNYSIAWNNSDLETNSRFAIQTGGNVGIGTTSPDYKLQVEGTGGTATVNGVDHNKIAVFRDDTGNSALQLMQNNNDIILASGYNGAGTIGLATRNNLTTSTRLHIANDGDVGIGTNAPATKLHVTSTASANGNRYNSRHHLETTGSTLSANRTSVSLQASTNATDVDRNGKKFYVRGADLQSTVRGTTSATDVRGSYSTGTHRTTGTTSALYGSYNLSQSYNHASVNGVISNMYGSFNAANLNVENTTNVNNAYGTYGRVNNSNSDPLNFARGVFGEYRSNGTSGDITHANGVYGYVHHIGQNSTISNSYGLRSYTYLNHDGGTIDNAYGVHSRIYRRKGTSNNAYLYYGLMSGSHGQEYGLYLDDASSTVNMKHFLDGNVGIGEKNPEAALHVNGSVKLPSHGSGNQKATNEDIYALYVDGSGNVVTAQEKGLAFGALIQQKFAKTSPARQTIVSATPVKINGLEITITPTNPNSIIEIEAYISSSATHVSSYGIFRNGQSTISTNGHTNSNHPDMQVTEYHHSSVTYQMHSIPIYHFERAGTTSPITYDIRALASWGSLDYALYINNRSSNDMASISYMTVREVVGEEVISTSIIDPKELTEKSDASDQEDSINMIKDNGMLQEQLDLQLELIQELQARLNELSNQQKPQDIGLTEGAEVNSNMLRLSSSEKAHLAQNKPNPSSNQTVIDYSIPTNAQYASIQFYRTDGALIEEYRIDHTGPGELNIDVADLNTGTYTYFLLVDGELIDSKKMIINR